MTTHTAIAAQPCKTAIYSALRQRNPSLAIDIADKVPFAAWPKDAALFEARIGKRMLSTVRHGQPLCNLSADERQAETLRIIAQGGATFADIQARITASAGSISGDLRALLSSGKIEGPFRRMYYTAGKVPQDVRDELARKAASSAKIDRQKALDDKFVAVLGERPMTAPQMATLMGISRTAASRRMVRLEQQGRTKRIGLDRSGMGTPGVVYAATGAPHSANSGTSAMVRAEAGEMALFGQEVRQ